MAEQRTPKVIIAGGGVGGLEAALALREAAGHIVAIELVAPEDTFVYRAMTVAEPFGYSRAQTLPLGTLWRSYRVRHRRDAVVGVEMEGRRVRLASGATLVADATILAVGARPVHWRDGAVTFTGPSSVGAVRDVLARLERGEISSVLFAAPPEAHWTVPVYELALLTAAWCADHHLPGVELSVLTSEAEPLDAFGPAATRMVRELLDNRGIKLVSADAGADVTIALPMLEPPALDGLPAGFIAVDEFGRVPEMSRAYAIGDATEQPFKQGGLAAQQADVAAAAVAYALAWDPSPSPLIRCSAGCC